MNNLLRGPGAKMSSWVPIKPHSFDSMSNVYSFSLIYLLYYVFLETIQQTVWQEAAVIHDISPLSAYPPLNNVHFIVIRLIKMVLNDHTSDCYYYHLCHHR